MYFAKEIPLMDDVTFNYEHKKRKNEDEELNAFKEDPEYIEELPGQMAFDDFLLDDQE